MYAVRGSEWQWESLTRVDMIVSNPSQTKHNAAWVMHMHQIVKFKAPLFIGIVKYATLTLLVWLCRPSIENCIYPVIYGSDVIGTL